MKLQGFQLQAKKNVVATTRLEGYINLPKGARVVHVGARPPAGDLVAYAEVPDVETPPDPVDVVVLQDGDPVPDGYEYMGHILAVPLLFIYRRRKEALVLPPR